MCVRMYVYINACMYAYVYVWMRVCSKEFMQRPYELPSISRFLAFKFKYVSTSQATHVDNAV